MNARVRQASGGFPRRHGENTALIDPAALYLSNVNSQYNGNEQVNQLVLHHQQKEHNRL